MTNRNTKWLLALLLCAVMALGLCAASAEGEITTWAELQPWPGRASAPGSQVSLSLPAPQMSLLLRGLRGLRPLSVHTFPC